LPQVNTTCLNNIEVLPLFPITGGGFRTLKIPQPSMHFSTGFLSLHHYNKHKHHSLAKTTAYLAIL